MSGDGRDGNTTGKKAVTSRRVRGADETSTTRSAVRSAAFPKLTSRPALVRALGQALCALALVVGVAAPGIAAGPMRAPTASDGAQSGGRTTQAKDESLQVSDVRVTAGGVPGGGSTATAVSLPRLVKYLRAEVCGDYSLGVGYQRPCAPEVRYDHTGVCGTSTALLPLWGGVNSSV